MRPTGWVFCTKAAQGHLPLDPSGERGQGKGRT